MSASGPSGPLVNVYFNVIRENRILVKKSEYIGF